MKKLLISVIGATLLPVSMAFADTTTTTTTTKEDSNWFENVVGKYYQELNLTATQKTQLSDIHQKHRLAEEAEVKNVLTAEQNRKWDELKTSRKESYLRDNVEEVKK